MDVKFELKKIHKKMLFLLVSLFMVSFGIYKVFDLNLIPKKSYTADKFNIETIISTTDYDKDGIDDYSDIMLGARAYIETKPQYKSAYYEDGYPPDGVGVCTDVIWKAFKSAGYSLKDLVDEDINDNPNVYTTINKPDPNIDFRRVKNLKIFFERNSLSLTLDQEEIDQWQPGDIVIYPNHIAIVSDKRNKDGKPYIIHNAGQPVLEEDTLTKRKIIGHYRWSN